MAEIMKPSGITVHRFRGRDGVHLACRETGVGRPLVLFHGFTNTAAQAWISHGYAARLAVLGFRVIMPDLRGHGDSAKPHDAASYPPDILADDGFSLIESLQLTDYDLGGYSLGARVVMRMLAKGAMPGRAVLGGQGVDVLNHFTNRTAKYRSFLSNAGPFRSGSQEWALEDWVKASGADPEALRLILDTFVDTPLEVLGRVTVPTFVIVGDEDRERASGDKLAAAMPNGRFVPVHGNHMTAFPNFIAAIEEFLRADP